jgi:hypothetical protein
MRYFLALILVCSAAFAQTGSDETSSVLGEVYGPQIRGCVQKSVTTTGHNRVGPFEANRLYVVYGYNGSDINAGDTVKCVWGDKTIDVTGLPTQNGLTIVGETIFANQQKYFFVKKGYQWISCISKTATYVVDICPREQAFQ